jgi:hypothetical protein
VSEASTVNAGATGDDLVLGRYRPLNPIGSGGSGSVWLARDERGGREVALKIVARDGKAGSRARREVEAASRLRHRRCLRPLDFGLDDQHVYIAYRHVEGKTLRQALRDGEVDDRRAIEICAQVLEALEHAHSQGIVHRDVKPANILLAKGYEIDVRLVDFGLARFAEAETLTALGDIPGTLAYISPERLAGDEATPAADVWSVGVALWEALVGWHPFWAGSMLETARHIESGAPSLPAMRPDLPRTLLAAVEGALASNPDERPEAGELARVLRQSLVRAGERHQRQGQSLAAGLRKPDPARVVHALAAAVVVAWGTSLFPFYPAHTQALLAILAGLTTLRKPWAGSAFSLSLLVLPLGNYSFGLALVFAFASAGWLAYTWRNPLSTHLPLLGPLATALGALFLLPLALLPLRGAGRRALVAFTAFSLSLIVAGVSGGSFPLTGESAPHDLGIEGSASPISVAGSLIGTLTSRPVLLAQAILLACAAASLPVARHHGRWAIAGFAAVMMILSLVPFPSVSPAPVMIASWLTASILGLLQASSKTAVRAVVPKPVLRPPARARRIAV